MYGWGFGLGVEQKFSDTFALRLEYRRAEYGRKSFTVLDEAPDTFGADALIDMQKANIVELGVIFHF
jgi:opacity protein-like surface antigen